MATRIQSHQLKNGLLVSGPPDSHPKDKSPTMASSAVPYTGGDVKNSGDLGKMFDIPNLPKYPHQLNSNSGSGPFRKTPTSSTSSNTSSSFSGPNPLQPTGLITSGPLRRSGQLDFSMNPSQTAKKTAYGSAVTSLGGERLKVGFNVSRAVVWVLAVVWVMGLLVGAFLTVAVKKAVILVAVGGLLVPIGLGVVWNCFSRRRGMLTYLQKYPEAELRDAVDGQFVKVTGYPLDNEVVTCGSTPLESSYQGVPRCVYISTELFEYRGWGGKSAHPKHCFFSWGSRHAEKYVADFYISDFQSGLRALVKAGYGAKVAPLVKPATVVDVVKDNKDLSPSFLRWLADRNLSSDDRIMRLKEGHIKEGSTMSVMGVVHRHDNVLMIVPPQEPVSTGCQWFRCLVPTYVEGLVLLCDDNQDADVIPV